MDSAFARFRMRSGHLMSSVEPDKLGSTATQGASGQPRRPRPLVWPAETGDSLDTFATPSEAAPPTDVVLEGPEPAVFGGLNPDQPEGDEQNDPLGTPLEEAVRGNELLPEPPHIEWARVIRSSWFLLTSMIVLLIGGSIVIWLTVPTETWVETSITFNQYTRLTEDEALDLQLEMKGIVQTTPLRTTAKEVLTRRSPDVKRAGFLDNPHLFFRTGALTWNDDGQMRLRVDSNDPSSDIVRLSALVEAFHIEMLARNKNLENLKRDLAEQQALLQENQRRSESLTQESDALKPDGERYFDLKERMQSLERYLQFEDESNPLRLTARLNLAQMVEEAAKSREASVRRDGLMTTRDAVDKQTVAILGEIARLERKIEVFAFASPPDPKNLTVHDTRGIQKYIMRGWWIMVIVGYGALVAGLHIIDAREAERARQERRELLRRRPKGTPVEKK